jgi:hypothetical protein
MDSIVSRLLHPRDAALSDSIFFFFHLPSLLDVSKLGPGHMHVSKGFWSAGDPCFLRTAFHGRLGGHARGFLSNVHGVDGWIRHGLTSVATGKCMIAEERT